MDYRAKEIIRIGDKLFGRKRVVDTLWQEIALNFYPERADFTEERNEGDEFSDHLFSSYPSLARRELGNLISANVRPQSQKWFQIHLKDMELDDESEERRYLEFISEVQWRAMYDTHTNFVGATKEADHDFAAFGNAVIYGCPNQELSGLLFKNYHLRDCAWTENQSREVDEMHRVWCPTAKQLVEKFGEDGVSREVKECYKKDPHKEFKCRHVVLPSRMFRKKKKNGEEFPYTSFIVECESEHVLEEVGLKYFPYVVPRWETVSDSVYGRSMATAIALPDSRTMQVVVRTLREAGEKYVDPPMIAVADAIRGDIPLYAGGITIADMEYDEKLGEVLRPVTQTSGSMPIGFEIAAALREDINSSFFLNSIKMPEIGSKEMTAYETRRRVEEHIRSAAPIFEPIAKESSAPLCELAFNIMLEHGGFPPPPESIANREVDWTFRSPISDLTDASESATFVDVFQRIVMPAAQVDPSIVENVDWNVATRDAMRMAGFKEKWLKPLEEVMAKKEEMEQAMKMQQMMAMAQQGGEAVEQGGKAAQEVQAAMKDTNEEAA